MLPPNSGGNRRDSRVAPANRIIGRDFTGVSTERWSITRGLTETCKRVVSSRAKGAGAATTFRRCYFAKTGGLKWIGFDTLPLRKLSIARSIILRVLTETIANGFTICALRGCKMMFPFLS